MEDRTSQQQKTDHEGFHSVHISTLRKILKFHLLSSCKNFVKTQCALRKRVFPQNFRTSNLGKVTVFYAVPSNYSPTMPISC